MADGGLTSTENPRLAITPVAGRIGAEVAGIRLTGDISDRAAAQIEEALARHKVLFFRGQTHLEDAGQEAFAARLGRAVAHPTVPVSDGSSYLLELDSERGGRANSWRTDITFTDAYPKASIPRAVVVPQAGGGTMWADAAPARMGPPSR